MVKVLTFRLEKCFSPATIFLVEGSSEAGLFTYLSNHVFPSPQLQKYNCYEGHIFLENV